MRFNRLQITLLISLTFFFALQFLPHRSTSLVTTGAPFLYLPLAAFLLLMMLLGTALSVLVWIAARNEYSRLNRRNWVITLVLALAIAMGLTAGNYAYTRGLPLGSFARSFDQQDWAASPLSWNGDITERQKMLGDMINKIIINGHRDEIVEELGPSDGGPFDSAERDLIYRLGPQRDGFSIDDEWLLIWLDDQGQVVRYDVWTD